MVLAGDGQTFASMLFILHSYQREICKYKNLNKQKVRFNSQKMCSQSSLFFVLSPSPQSLKQLVSS